MSRNINNYQSTRCHTLEDSTLYRHHCEDWNFHRVKIIKLSVLCITLLSSFKWAVVEDRWRVWDLETQNMVSKEIIYNFNHLKTIKLTLIRKMRSVNLYTTYRNISRHSFARTVYLCFVWLSQYTGIISLDSIKGLVFIMET